jgi:hemerythrin-like domain-containing protein
MTNARRSLRDEHLALVKHLEHLRAIADSIGTVPIDDLRNELEHVSDTLVRQLLPHAEHEDRMLYDAMVSNLGAPTAASLLRPDHVELRALADEFATVRAHLRTPLEPTAANDLRRILYGMYAILKLHFAKEEQLYLSFIEENTFRLRDSH